MPEQIKFLATKETKTRVILILAIFLTLGFGWFSVRWQIGDMLASLTAPGDPNAREISDLAKGLSPADPITSWLGASVEKDLYVPEKIASSVQKFEDTVRLGPHDFRWWLELGRAYEQAERPEEAQKAFLRAVELAPNYTFPHWSLGNFYLRQGRGDEAFVELQKAASNNPVYREQVYSIAWDFYEKDPARLEQLADDRPEMRAGLAKFYAARELPQDSLRIWNTLSETDKQSNAGVAKLVAQALYDKRFYRSAVEFIRQLGIEPQAQAETVLNAGFESEIGTQEAYFGWKVTKLAKVEVKRDPTKKKEGNFSLRVSLGGFPGIEIKNIWQTVVVQPNKKYKLSFWVRTEDLKSPGPPTMEIVNANDDQLITTSAPFAEGTNDWQPVKIQFTAPPNAEAVLLRINRAYCGEGCPISGTFWMDDFKLTGLS